VLHKVLSSSTSQDIIGWLAGNFTLSGKRKEAIDHIQYRNFCFVIDSKGTAEFGPFACPHL
jgi:hypothetical protein